MKLEKSLLVPWFAMAMAFASFAVHFPEARAAEDAPTTETRARQYYAEGTEHFQAGRYLEAGAAFTAGFELSHKPGFLWNMAECARLAGHRERALELYRRYSNEAPDGKQRPEAEMHIRELEPPPAPKPPPIAPAPNVHHDNDVFRRLPADSPDKKSTPVTQRWWFWTGAAAVVAGAVVTGVVLATSGGTESNSPTGPSVDWRSR